MLIVQLDPDVPAGWLIQSGACLIVLRMLVSSDGEVELLMYGGYNNALEGVAPPAECWQSRKRLRMFK